MGNKAVKSKNSLEAVTMPVNRIARRAFSLVLGTAVIGRLCLGMLAIATSLIFAQSSFAQEQEAEGSNEHYGTTAYALAPDLSVRPETIATFKPSVIVSKASYATGGTSLRNRGAGNINISGLVGAPTQAYIYWGVITAGAAPTAVKGIKVQRLFATESTEVSLTGEAIGNGVSPWTQSSLSIAPRFHYRWQPETALIRSRFSPAHRV
jgi:hypothetical protein